MQVALAMYQTRLDTGKWAALTSEQEELQALKTELVQLKNLHKRNTNKNKIHRNKTNNRFEKHKQKTRQYPDWKKKEPTEQEKQAGNKKKIKDKWFYWCPNHKMWTAHKPEDCKGIAPRK